MPGKDTSVSLTVAFVGETKGLDGKLASTAKKVDGLDEQLAGLGARREAAGGAVLAGTVAGLAVATRAAGDLGEAQAKANSVFGDSVGVIDEFAAGATDALALSKREAYEATGTFGNLFTQMGLGQQQAAGMSTAMVTLGGDFAAYHDANPVEVIEAQTAAFRGEYDALQRYVPTINAAAVEKRALADSGKASADQLTAEEKVLATYAIMMESAGAASGAAAREGDGLAMSTKRAKAELENSAASIGSALLPAAAAAVGGLADLVAIFDRLPAPLQTAIVGLGGTTVGLGLLAPKVRDGAQALGLGVDKLKAFASGSTTAGATARTMLATLASSPATMGAAAVGVGLLAAAAVAMAEDTDAAADAADRLAESATDAGVAIDVKFREQLAKTLAGVEEGALDDSENLALFSERMRQTGIAAEDVAAGLLGTDAEYQKLIDNVTAAKDAQHALNEEYEQDDFTVSYDDDQFDYVIDKLGDYRRQGELARGTQENLVEVQNDLGVATGDLADDQTKLAGATTKATNTFEDQADAARDLFDLHRGSAAAAEDVADAMVGVVEAQEAVGDAEQGVADARGEAADAALDVADARGEVADAEQDVADAHAQVDAALDGVAEARTAEADAVAAQTVARDQLAQAEREAAGDSDALRAAQEGVATAQERLSQTQRDGEQAQRDLTQARVDATERLADMETQLKGTALSEREARLSLAEAQERLGELDADATANERERAAINLERAQLALTAAIAANADQAAELEAARAAGVEGSDEVVGAQEAIAAAADTEADAQRQLEDAVQNVADTQTEANARVVEAQERLTEATDEVGAAQQRIIDAEGAVVEAQRGVQTAVDGVADANRRVAEAVDQAGEAQQRVTDAQEAVVAARGAVEGAERTLNDALFEQIDHQREVETATLGAREATRLYIERIREHARLISPNDPYRQDLLSYADDLDRLFSISAAIQSLGELAPPGAVNAERQNRSAGPKGGGRADDKGPAPASSVLADAEALQLLRQILAAVDKVAAQGRTVSVQMDLHGINDVEAQGEVIMRRAARVLSLEGA